MTAIFRGSLAESLRFGHVLEICAKAKEGAQSFNISICTGDPLADDSVDIGLQISVMIKENMLWLRKRLSNDWCDEETQTYETADFLKEFKIYIIMADEKFHISLNKESLGSYKYRLRLSRMNYIEIDGDLEYVSQVDHRKYFPYTWPPIQVVEERLQFSNDVPMPFKPGHVIVVDAQLTGNDKGRLLVHLRNIWDIERQELHLSIRFDTKVVVRTSKTVPDGEHFSFDEEQRDGDFPFEDFLKPFRLVFAFTANEVKIAKDGCCLCFFEFRTPKVLSVIGGLKIFGTNELKVNISKIDHRQMDDVLCVGFENLSIME